MKPIKERVEDAKRAVEIAHDSYRYIGSLAKALHYVVYDEVANKVDPYLVYRLEELIKEVHPMSVKIHKELCNRSDRLCELRNEMHSQAKGTVV